MTSDWERQGRRSGNKAITPRATLHYVVGSRLFHVWAVLVANFDQEFRYTNRVSVDFPLTASVV
jgi:hypothetical protein